MRRHLLIRLKGPLQAWGDVALDPRRPTRDFPSRSALAGLMASALGWEYRDAERTTALQDELRYAVREDRRPLRIRDFQTVDLGRESTGWTRWGIERRGGSASEGTHILRKDFLADGSLLVAATIGAGAPAGLDEIASALRYPARPLFLGRRCCPPSTPLFEGLIDAESPYAALTSAPLDPAAGSSNDRYRCWYDPDDAPPVSPDQYSGDMGEEIWDRRDFLTNRFTGSRRVVVAWLDPALMRRAG
ncbi:MAG: type I-E CRISPR-associated protein Cas5/CasD [Gemmatimonadaceae bacterium]